MAINNSLSTEIDRHKAALVRTDLSRPVKTALEAGLIQQSFSVFDYGCGHGGDVQRLTAMGFQAQGWDPYFRPDHQHVASDVVNLGYVLNVIEKPTERIEALRRAWELTQRVLIVSAQVLLDYLSDKVVAFGDGVITSRNTFQKYFKQEELKFFIDSTLGVDAVPAGLGIYFVFRHEQDAESFRLSRFHSRRATPRVRLHIKTFDECQERLQPLMDFVSDRGRMPVRGELPIEQDLIREFGSLHRAFKLVVSATSKDEWEEVIERRKQDLLLYIALSKFGKRPRMGHLPHEIQNDIASLFGSYKAACETADQILFSLGQVGIIGKTCHQSKIGKLVPDGLYVHISALDELDLILRLYEGCASRTVGRMDSVTIVKFHNDKPQISYLYYPEFDTDPHPVLHTSVRINLQDLHVKFSDYETSANPPILHRKETFVAPTYPLYEKFAELTRQEVAKGLLDNPAGIGNRNAWTARLNAAGVQIRDHCLVDTLALADESFPKPKAVDLVFTNSSSSRSSEAGIDRESQIGKSCSDGGPPKLTPQELRTFINSKMSTTHIYQPVILLMLLENNGRASLQAIAETCSVIGGKPAATYSASLVKYPRQALIKHGVISSSGRNEFNLALELNHVPHESKQELIEICKAKLASAKNRKD